MKILAIERERRGARSGDFEPHLQAEAKRVWDLHTEGIVRESYFAPATHTAVLVLECGGVEEARAVLSTLPLVRANLIEFEVLQLAPYTGYERLFCGG